MVGNPVRAPAPDNAMPGGSVEPLLTTYDDALPADKLMVGMVVPDATTLKAAPVTHEGVIETI